MCGIAGYIPSPNATTRLHEDVAPRLARALDAIAHRGPDGRGMHIDPATGVALGHVRLSIIDLTNSGAQPMSNEDGHIAITYNGEVYNYRALRDALITAGHVFASHTDTEVLVHGYEQWGLRGLLDRLRGMFAFVIYDKVKGVVHFARDAFGIKPLFINQDDSGLTFGSEPKAVEAFRGRVLSIDGPMLVESLHHMAAPSPSTIYAGMSQLEPGTSRSFALDGSADTTERYWRWSPTARVTDAAAAGEQVWTHLVQSVERHLVSDVPVGVFLSAGLDSSLIAAACAELGVKPTCLTLAIDDPRYDESPIAADLCKRYGFEHWVHRMGPDECKRWNDQIGAIYDEPYGVSGALTALEVCGIAAKRFKVMLSGDGGDELFGGYGWYTDWLAAYGVEGRRRSAWNRARSAVRRFAGRRAMPDDALAGYAQLVGAFTPREVASLFTPKMLGHQRPTDAYRADHEAAMGLGLTGFDYMQWLDMGLFLPGVCLTKMDRASMHHGLEVRVPMLDRALAEAVGSIAWQTRNPGLELKGLLKQVAQAKLPASVLGKRKQGFAIKTSHWLPTQAVVAEVRRDMRAGDWWRDVFHPQVDRAVAKLRGRQVWRFRQTWCWVRRRVVDDGVQIVGR